MAVANDKIETNHISLRSICVMLTISDNFIQVIFACKRHIHID